MFEQSMVVSQVQQMPAKARWTWAGSLLLQSCAALLLILGPVLHPERLVLNGTAPRAFVPVRVVKSEEVKVKQAAATSAWSRMAAMAVSGPRVMTAPAQIPHGVAAGDPPAMGVSGFMEGAGTGLPGAIAEAGPAARVEVAPAKRATGPLRISSGVGAGMLISPIRPVYPSIARAAHVEGVVVVSAVISREGRIERAHVLSGPAMLASAALEAVATARYTPYRLNGAATEVETTITVNFRMGG